MQKLYLGKQECQSRGDVFFVVPIWYRATLSLNSLLKNILYQSAQMIVELEF